MRVITGTARGRKLKTLEGLDIRPTADRVKEAVFSMIQFEVEGSFFLDLFAGSGQMGIEALSRGAKTAVFVDESRAAQTVIRENLTSTGLASNARVAAMDAAAYLTGTKEPVDIAWLDPPYRKGLLHDILPAVASRMSERGVILCEHEKLTDLPEIVGHFRLYRQNRYGKTFITVYRRADTDGE